MKEITLEDLKTEINNNLWRVRSISTQQLEYRLHCYARFSGDELDVFIIFNKKDVLKICSINTKKDEWFMKAVTCYYQDFKILTLDFEERISIEKQEMNKEIFDLLVTTTELPF
jgi:hypothetical protein